MIYTQNLKHSVPDKIVLIGASTGGPGQIEKIIRSLPILENTSLIIAQHMVPGFIGSFVKRLQEYTQNPIMIAEDMQTINRATIYFCEGETEAVLQNTNFHFRCKIVEEYNFNPDINKIFHSFVPIAKNTEILSIILTGIGEDGVDGCKELSLKGVVCLTETQKSAIVDGMPSRARELVPNIYALDIEDIVQRVKEFCS